MIGVIVDPSEQRVVTEFFELFKTPWELYRSDRHYDVLLCCGDGELHEHAASLILIYAGRKLPFDAERDTRIACHNDETRFLSFRGTRVPIYGASITFREEGTHILVDEQSHKPAIRLEQSKERVVARVGYDLFREVRTLLTAGQPAVNAGIPALELHIAILRDLIVASGVRLVEIPPVPEGYRFIACLTHDVDHPSIRQHKFDHTMFGFLYRAVFRSLFNLLRGRATLGQVLKNWGAAWKLPFVYLGLAKDFWQQFDRYPELEKGHRSSFFVIPFKGDPGRRGGSLAPKRRASGYGATDIAGQIQDLVSAGCEIGLHGIDAWHDSSKGRDELERIRRITGAREIGTRIHWLYFDGQSPVTLERAGADYDSTMGFNETVGYRAGTTQAYRPLEATRLLELPLHIMDTALFYPTYLDLSPREARELVGTIINNAVQFGGAVTVNWHDRSIAPERCWGDFYVDLVEQLKSKGAWFATASETVSWFRKRRSATFENIDGEWGVLEAVKPTEVGADLPALHLRVNKAQKPCQAEPVAQAR